MTTLATAPPTGLEPLPIHLDQLVQVTSHYEFGGRDQHARIGLVATIHDYRHVIPGDDTVIVEVRLLAGHDVVGRAAWHWGTVPFRPDDLTPLTTPAGHLIIGSVQPGPDGRIATTAFDPIPGSILACGCRLLRGFPDDAVLCSTHLAELQASA